MRWNCPHCGVNLAIGDDKISGGWAFSRCYKCGGHALVRKAEISVIKVDRAPPGERLILPEASDSPNVGMNPVATQNFARTAALAHSSQAAAAAAALMAATPPPMPGIPNYESLPMMDVRGSAAPHSFSSRMLPVAMGIAGAMAVGSGFYLYVQGQNLWNKATRIAHAPVREPMREVAQNDDNSESVRTSQAAPAIDIAKAAARMNVPTAVAPIAAQPAIPVEPSITERTNAISAEMLIKIKGPSTQLRSGPGLAFPVLGTANPAYSYKVVEWKDRWFRIAEMTEGKTLGWVRNDQVATQ